MSDRLSQKKKVLRTFIKSQVENPGKWHFPYEFIGEGDLYVGYKAPTRFVELCNEYPSMIESRFEGKYRVGRFRFDNSLEFLPKLPVDFQVFVKAELERVGIGYEIKKLKPVKVGQNTVKMVEGVGRVL